MNNQVPTRLGQIIKRNRKYLKVSLAALSKESGVAKGYLHELENSGSANPSVRVLAKLSAALEFSALDMFEIIEEAASK